jgi:hypothetical protein
MVQKLDPRYIDGHKLMAMLESLFAGQAYSASVGELSSFFSGKADSSSADPAWNLDH